jgi:ribosome-binding protein aMBF1 (putative translation factor)
MLAIEISDVLAGTRAVGGVTLGPLSRSRRDPGERALKQTWANAEPYACAHIVTVVVEKKRVGRRRRRPVRRTSLNERIGARIRRLRTKAGLSQAQLGAPYSRAMVSAVERGRVAPSLVALAHFAKKLKVSMRALLPPD